MVPNILTSYAKLLVQHTVDFISSISFAILYRFHTFGNFFI